jgi:hypothetical protein
MSHLASRTRPLAALALALLTGLALVACGSSSGGSTAASAKGSASAAGSTGASAAGSSATKTGGSSAGSARTGSQARGTSTTAGSRSGSPVRLKRFSALRACLARNGITLPTRSSRGLRPFGLPTGVSRAQYETALRKCGALGAKHFEGFNSSARRASFVKFASCMRENGIALPAPNASGNGPVFDLKGLSPASAAFRTAERKCSPDLRLGFFAHPGTRAGSGSF